MQVLKGLEFMGEVLALTFRPTVVRFDAREGFDPLPTLFFGFGFFIAVAPTPFIFDHTIRSGLADVAQFPLRDTQGGDQELFAHREVSDRVFEPLPLALRRFFDAVGKELLTLDT